MENAFIFLLIFGVLLLLTAAGLAFSKDPRQSPLLGRVVGIEKMSKERNYIAYSCSSGSAASRFRASSSMLSGT